MVSVSSSAWRRMRGEKQDGQRGASPASFRQSRQNAAIRAYPAPRPRQAPTRARSISVGIDALLLGEGDQQRLVAERSDRARRRGSPGRGRRCGYRRGQRRWRRGSRRGVPARRPGRPAPRRRAARRPRGGRGLCCCGFCRFSWRRSRNLSAQSLAIRRHQFRKIGCELVTAFNRRCYTKCDRGGRLRASANFVDLSDVLTFLAAREFGFPFPFP